MALVFVLVLLFSTVVLTNANVEKNSSLSLPLVDKMSASLIASIDITDMKTVIKEYIDKVVKEQVISSVNDSVATALKTAVKNKPELLTLLPAFGPSDCGELDMKNGQSGVHTIYPDGTPGFDVYCEMDKDGGGWTVFQRRKDGTVNFFRDWDAYKYGFGPLNSEFWLGNEHLYQITSQGNYTLRIEMEDFESNSRYAEYSSFTVGPESSGYKLEVSGYNGNAGDGMENHQNGNKFSTKDQDNDKWYKNCAQDFKGGWWYGSCHISNLNGLYLRGKHDSFADGINWKPWKGYRYSLKSSVMMIKRQ